MRLLTSNFKNHVSVETIQSPSFNSAEGFPFSKVSFFFICYLTVPWQILGHCWGDSPSNSTLITAFYLIFDPEVFGNLVTRLSLSPIERLLEFTRATFYSNETSSHRAILLHEQQVTNLYITECSVNDSISPDFFTPFKL